MKLKTFLRGMVCIFTAALMAAALCVVPASAASVKLNKTSVKLPIGYSVTLKVSGISKSVSWSSSDSDIALIKSSNGKSAKIVGKKTGSAYIYAKAKGINLKCKVTVKKSFISANEDDIELNKGESETVRLTVKGSKKITYSISDKDICSVSWGKWKGDSITLTVKAKKSGKSYIKVYAKNYSKSTAETIEVEVNGRGDDGFDEIDYDDFDDDDYDDDYDDDSMTEEVIDIVNDEREDRGLNELESDPTLNEVAAMRAKEIAEQFSHTRPDGTSCFTALHEYGVTNVYAAENIAMGSKTPEGVMDQWMGSKRHKENILGSDYTRMGVGLYVDSRGDYYWVQVFTSNF